MKPIAYRSTVPGNEGTPLIPVMELSPEEAGQKRLIEEANKRIREARDTITRWEDVIKQANCKHHVFNDTAGFPYDSRHCHICGAHMGFV